ncbi:glycosyltransferase [Thiobacillus sedimenti]|uniref:Glycosyltransferase family 2 protein n=1 Tax=Thiobacillus sedimenti TaxID=3110231 RepID=A0ABZ1CKA0_9PROT|nr:glycosyltransferase family 2 protein [Thiobacillus sp. SCUT-2]WRS39634.1 glycosyltransferase family 2 protein [Thiobacillus sp. SCUT-2]
MSETLHPWPVAVFAHNEARNIIACLDSLQAAASRPLACHVLANACTDRTEALVREYAADHPDVRLVSIALGDKANAWNVFVHEVVAHADTPCFFIDGDVRATPGALDAMARALAQHPQANGVSALPRSGRGVKAFQRDMLRDSGVAGNLYGLRAGFVERIRAQAIKMPIGTIGEDALMGAMLKWDLRGDSRWDNARVVVAREAGFEFDSVSPWLPREWKKYFRRRVRYSVRGYQNKMLGRAIQPAGFAALPHHVRELYPRYPEVLRLEWRGLNTLFDWLALHEIRTAR